MSHLKPKVSVCVVAYNQEKYIAECLQSLVDQETNFPFEIIVADDCSPDATGAIIRDFAERYPERIKPIWHEKNIGPNANYLAAHAAARGEYIAHMDGDDLALPGKLQAQADHLDANTDCAIVWHRMKIRDERRGAVLDDLIDVGQLPAEGIRQDDLLAIGSVACHSSKMYRAKDKPDVSKWQFLDFFIDAHQLQFGNGHYLPGFFGVYRANVGVSSSGYRTREVLIDNLLVLAKKFPKCRRAISSHLLRLTLADVVHRRPTLGRSSRALLEVFSPLSVVELVARRRYLKMFRSPL